MTTAPRSTFLPTGTVGRGELVGWFAVVALLDLVTGLGIVAALVLVLTRLRACSLRVRVGLVAFAVVFALLVLALAFLGLQTGSTHGESGPAFEVN